MTTLLYTDPPATKWLDLQDIYEITNMPQIFQMMYDINFMSQGEDNIWDQLDSCMQKSIFDHGNYTCDTLNNFLVLESKDRVLQFLLGLNESHMSMHGHVHSSKALPTLIVEILT